MHPVETKHDDVAKFLRVKINLLGLGLINEGIVPKSPLFSLLGISSFKR